MPGTGRGTSKTVVGFYLGMAILLVGLALPPLPGLSPAAQHSLAILLFGIVFWATEAVDSTVTALTILVLLPLTGVLTYEQTIANMGTIMIWRLVGILMVTAGVQKCGLDRRIAFNLLKLARGNVRGTLFLFILTTFLFVFIVPASFGRTAALSAIALGVINALKVKYPSNTAKFLLLALALVSILSSSAIIVGASVELYAADLFDKLAGFQWTYLTWMKTNLPTAFVVGVLVFPLFMVMFPPEVKKIPGGVEFIRKELQQMGPLSRDEKVVAVLFTIQVAMWLLDLSDKFPAEMLVGTLMLMPGIRILTWKEASNAISWGTLLLFGASLALAVGLQSSGLVALISDLLFYLEGASPVVVAAAIALITIFIRLGMANMTGVVAVILPITIAFANNNGINPVWLGMIPVVVSTIGFFFPSQSPSAMVTYSFGYYTTRDMLKAGLAVGLMMLCATLLAARFYWPLIGLSIYR